MVIFIITILCFITITSWMYIKGKEIDHDIYNEQDNVLD